MRALIQGNEATVSKLQVDNIALITENSSLRERVHDLESKIQELSLSYKKRETSYQETINELESKLGCSISEERAAKDQESILLADLKSREIQIQKYDADLVACRTRISELESALRAALGAQVDNTTSTDAVRAELIEMKVQSLSTNTNYSFS